MFKNLDLKKDQAVPYDLNEEFIMEFLDDLISDPKAVRFDWIYWWILDWESPFSPLKIPGIVETCKQSDHGANACDYAFNAYKCFFEESRKVPGLAIEGTSLIDLVLVPGMDRDKDYNKEKDTNNDLRRLRLGLFESDEDWTEMFGEEDETKIPNDVTAWRGINLALWINGELRGS